ncbi:MAG TPA: thioredoxin domain-containing protein [Ferruginibacter sp.]|jgi:uncharacterized protein YyaL (SSP411 family)|nr:thioredoxin domain-containing protein [Ferruginibacter sp.]
MAHQFTNSLAKETSPYLLQHAHNPVDWYPWGREALDKAEKEKKIILVSIGYAACHWCHVMERESFENEQTAQFMNEHFINIKIDREERPDLDHIYMDAVQAISGSGGWPLNVFLTPDKKPFYGGTYFPPVQAFNRSSWTEVLQGIVQAWKEKKHEIEAQAENLTAYLTQSNNIGQVTNTAIDVSSNTLFTKEDCHTIFENILKTADKEWGGFGNAPKFPQTFTIQYLLQYYHFTETEAALQQALLSLDKMLQGGIYDHVAGGLARYSTDKEWLAPHFEKMLYDNALLIIVLCDAFQITGNKKYEKAIRKTIAFIKEELLSETGGFYAALDADSEGVEGKYYVWQKTEIENIVGKDAVLLYEYFNVTAEGNWEETNILRILTPIDEFVKEKGLNKEAFEQSIENSLQQLKSVRSKRIKPLLDDKIILSWNALMLNAISKAAAILQDDTYKQIAEKNFQFILSNFKKKESFELQHTFKNGVAKYPAFLDDYAYLIEACIAVYEITFDTSYLTYALHWCNYVTDNFSDDEDRYFFYTNKAQEDIIVRKKEIYDGAVPSGNAVMAINLFKLSVLFDKIAWRKRAEDMLTGVLPMTVKYPISFGVWSRFLLLQVAGLQEISIVGEKFLSLNQKISIACIPNKLTMCSFVDNNDFPMLAYRFRENQTLAYLCHDYRCVAPFDSADGLMIAVRAENKFK